MMHIMLASGDRMHARMTQFLLKDVGYNVTLVEDQHGLRDHLKQGQVDMILLDSDFPDLDGYVFCREIRAHYHTPIIFLAEECAVADRVRALKLGADDVLNKPFNPSELLARIEAVMRRYGDEFMQIYSAYEPMSVGTLRLDPVQRRVVIGDTREENLTEREFQLLYYLVQNACGVLSSRQLLQHIWGIDDVTDSNLVPVYIGRLRKKIETDPLRPNHIVRVRDLGHSFHP
ncbi:MAG: response regulator transcription factor [Chloroflexales bacterium]